MSDEDTVKDWWKSVPISRYRWESVPNLPKIWPELMSLWINRIFLWIGWKRYCYYQKRTEEIDMASFWPHGYQWDPHLYSYWNPAGKQSCLLWCKYLQIYTMSSVRRFWELWGDALLKDIKKNVWKKNLKLLEGSSKDKKQNSPESVKIVKRYSTDNRGAATSPMLGLRVHVELTREPRTRYNTVVILRGIAAP